MRTFSFLILAACGPTAAVNAVKPDCADLVVGQLEITEVMIDPVGADTGNEWFEVLNRTSHLQSLIGVTVFARDAAGAEKTFVLKSGEIVPHGSFTLGDTTQPVLPDWVAASYGKSLGAFSAAGGSVGLRCAGVVLAQVDWHSGTKSGRSRMLDPREPQWCDAPLTARYEGENHGTPGEPNPPCLSAPTCLVGDAGVSREVVAPTPSTLRITEIMAAPKAANDSVGEWFEVQATDELDLNGVVVATSTGISTLESQACLHVFAGQYAIIARSADPFVNGGLPNPVAHLAGTFSSNNERVSLFIDDAGLDAVTLPKSTPGVSWQRGDDSSELCLSTSPWPGGSGDLGTPGARNSSCTPPDAGPVDTCIDAKTHFVRQVVVPPPAALTITEVLADPTSVTDEAGEWFEVLTSTGFDLNALTVANESGAASTLATQRCRWVDSGTSVLFSRNANPALNGGLPTVDATFSFSLGNSGARVITLAHGDQALARFAYTSTVPGASTQRDPASGQLCVTPAAMRYGPLGSHDRGTPGKPNVICP